MKLDIGHTVTGTRGKKIKLTEKIGEGGFGLVYKGRYGDGKDCVVKQANIWNQKGDVCKNKDIIIKKLNIEREILDRVGSHPQIPTMIDYDEELDPPYMATSFVRGKTLYEKLKTGQNEYKPLSEKHSIYYTLKLLDIVSHLHNMSEPVVHRDIKPANLLVHANKISLIDFGSSVAGWDGLDVSGETRIFTAGYGAPEQERGKASVDVRTDIYAVGATLFFLLTGKDLRYNDDCFYAPYDLRPPSVFNKRISKEVSDVVLKATKVFPEDRYQSASEMINALKGKTVREPTAPTLQLGGVEHDLDLEPGKSIKIGRKKGLSGAKRKKKISVNSNYVSDVHVKVERDKSGYWVRDMYSLNGTAVYLHDEKKWKRLGRGQRWKLYSGDKIALGYDDEKGPCIELIFRSPS